MKRLILALALPFLVVSGETTPPSPTYAGILPLDVDGGFAARLDSTQGQYLMSARSGMLVGFAFEHGSLVPRCSLPLPAPISDQSPNLGSPLATGTIAATGDVDGDRSDEVVVVGALTIRKYKLIHGTFALTAQARLGPDSGIQSAWCFDVCIGDVNNDGVNEVMLSGIQSPPPFEPDRVERPVTLYVCQWVGKTLVMLWNDHGALTLEGPSWATPIDKMAGVRDPSNSGRSVLLVQEGRSDVRASTFDELDWTPSGLREVGEFVVRDGRIQRKVKDSNPAHSAVDCDFAKIGAVTAVLAGMVQEDYVWQEEYLIFSRDSAYEHRVLWSDNDHHWYSPSEGILINLDGQGTGALRFMYSRDRGPKFEFYRL
jgi:hypothetical protein